MYFLLKFLQVPKSEKRLQVDTQVDQNTERINVTIKSDYSSTNVSTPSKWTKVYVPSSRAKKSKNKENKRKIV